MTLTEYSIQSRSFIPKITFRLSILIRSVSFLSSYKQIKEQETKRDLETEIDLFLLNIEFFSDSEAPHKNVVRTSIKVVIPDEYHVKARSIVNLIGKYQAELVALVEVKNRDCVELAQKHLNHKEPWQIIFFEGRDTFTGQEVAVPSKFPVIKETITNFPGQWSNYNYQGKSKSVRLYKDCELSIYGQSVYLIVAHLYF